MGELILCSQQLAAMPYYIENVSLNVYSLDELCYYIKNNTCLLDADFMDDELCDWVENEQTFAGYCTESKEYQGWRRCFV